MKNLRNIVLIVILMLSIFVINVYAEDAVVQPESIGSKTAVEHPALAPAEEPGAAASISSAFFYNYIWRGMLQHSGMAVQPDVNASFKGFTLDVWNDFQTVNRTWHETDFTLSYAIQTLPEYLSLSFGAIAYTVTGSSEVYDGYAVIGYNNSAANISLSVYVGDSEPTSTGAVNLNELHSFAILHALHSFELAKNFTFDLCLAGVTDFLDNTYGEAALPFNYQFSKHLTAGATYVIDAGNKRVFRPHGVISYGGLIVTVNL